VKLLESNISSTRYWYSESVNGPSLNHLNSILYALISCSDVYKTKMCKNTLIHKIMTFNSSQI